MVKSRPFVDSDQVNAKATEIWWKLDRQDWLEAFQSHPKIGEKKAAAQVSAEAEGWSSKEQSGIKNSTTQTLDELAKLNAQYEQTFGFIFIICATGKSADEILAILKSRITNDIEIELPIAAGEQAKITEIRLGKLVN